jgi:uncharacterized cupin superfamily protein
VQPWVTDVERLKTKVRKMAAGRVLAGDSADVRLDLARMKGCRARIAAGYGALSRVPQAVPADRLVWILDGYAEVHSAAGEVTHISQGGSLVLAGGVPVRLVFPQLTIYLSVEAEG